MSEILKTTAELWADLVDGISEADAVANFGHLVNPLESTPPSSIAFYDGSVVALKSHQITIFASSYKFEQI